MTELGHPVLIDFGYGIHDHDEHFTQSGVQPGTPAYMAPEVRTGSEPASRESDRYALSLIAYELITGQLPRLPYQAATADDMLPEAVQAIFAKALHPDPRQRFKSTGRFAAALRQALRLALQWRLLFWVERWWQRRRPRLLLSFSLLTAILIMVGIALGTTNTEAQLERLIHNIPMVQVPATCLTIGAPDSDTQPGRAAPSFWTCLPAFWIDVYPVSNAQYKAFTGKTPTSRSCTEPGRTWAFCSGRPVEKVSYFEASAFCTQRGARLPTEIEYEDAARGPADTIYPWGNIYDKQKMDAVGETVTDYPDDSQAYPAGRSWVGAYNLNSEVEQWTSSIYRAYPLVADSPPESPDPSSEYVVRGARWLDIPLSSLTAYRRSSLIPSSHADGVGFRCARSN